MPVIKYVTHRYHGKILTLQDAEKILKLDRDITVPKDLAETTVPWDHAYQIIFRNPDKICVVKCACRSASGHDCEPAHKCLIIGEPYVSFMLEHNKSAEPKKITQQEALEILKTCKKKGYVTNAYYKDGIGDRMYAICNCCPECCVAISGHKFFTSKNITESPLGHSGYLAQVNTKKCAGLGDCVAICPFNAIHLDNKNKAVVNSEICMGCGNCSLACSRQAISMKKKNKNGIALDIADLVPEIKQKQ